MKILADMFWILVTSFFRKLTNIQCDFEMKVKSEKRHDKFHKLFVVSGLKIIAFQ